jgi:Holliday junction resolvase
MNEKDIGKEIVKKECGRVDFWFYGKHNEKFLYYEDTFFGLKNKILLKNLESEPELSVSDGCLTMDKIYPPRSRHSIAELEGMVERIKLIREGYAILHASCLSNNINNILLPAYPNVGKTLSCLQLLENGYKYLSDDTVKISSKGVAYLTSFASAVGHYDFLRFIKPKNIGRMKFAKFSLKARLMQTNKLVERLLSPPLIELGKIYGTKEQTKVNKVCVIEIAPRKVEKISRELMLEKITKINQYCLPRVSNNPVIQAYSYFNDSFSAYDIEEKEKDNIKEFLSHCDEFYSLSCNDWNWLKLFEEIGIA